MKHGRQRRLSRSGRGGFCFGVDLWWFPHGQRRSSTPTSPATATTTTTTASSRWSLRHAWRQEMRLIEHIKGLGLYRRPAQLV
jgi:hypothetical protein